MNEGMSVVQIHEYQAKRLLAQHGVPVPDGEIAYTATEAEAVGRRLQDWPLVVKSQIHAGGRGKAGGIRIVRTLDELRDAAERMIGVKLVTGQTGPQGKTVGKIYIEKATDIARELYISLTINRTGGGLTVVASAEGGMEIEALAEREPEKIVTFHLGPGVRLRAFHARKIAAALGFGGAAVARGGGIHPGALCRLFPARRRAGRGQSLGGDERRRDGRPGRQNEL